MKTCGFQEKAMKIRKRPKYLVFGYLNKMNLLLNIPIPIPIKQMILSYYYNKDKTHELKDNINDVLLTIFDQISIIPFIILNRYSSFDKCKQCNTFQWEDNFLWYECYGCCKERLGCSDQCSEFTYECNQGCPNSCYCKECYDEISNSIWKQWPCHEETYTDDDETSCTVCWDQPCYQARECGVCGGNLAICWDCIGTTAYGDSAVCNDCKSEVGFCNACHKTFEKEELYKMPLDGNCDGEDDWNVLCLDCVGVIGVQEFKGITFGPDMREFE